MPGNSNRIIRFTKVPGGRIIGINFNSDDQFQAPLSCSNLPSYAFITIGTLSVDIPLSASSDTLTFSCRFENVDVTVELQTEPSSVALISSSSLVSKNTGIVSGSPEITDDGKWIVFEGAAFGLSGRTSIYRKNVSTGLLELISSSDGATLEDGNSYAPQITPNGLWMVFYSTSSNLVTTGGGGSQIYLKDLTSLNSPPLLVSSVDSSQPDQTSFKGDGSSHAPQITPDGKWVVFRSDSSNFVTGGSQFQIYLKDLTDLSSPPILVSSNDSTIANQMAQKGDSLHWAPQITPDGRWMVFESDSTNYVTGGGGRQIYLKDRYSLNSPPLLVSSLDATQADQTSFKANISCWGPQITSDGKWLIFKSDSSNLALGGGGGQVYLKSLTALGAPPLLVSSTDSSAGNQLTNKGDNNSYSPRITPDGRWVVFHSDSTNFVTGTGGDQIYLKDLNSASSPPILLSSLDSSQADQTNFSGDSGSSSAKITSDGRWVVFRSSSSNFIAGGGGDQIYLKDLNDLSSAPILLSSLDSSQTPQASFRGNLDNAKPQITPDGKWMVFESSSTNYVTGGGGDQIYLKDLTDSSFLPVLLTSLDATQPDQSAFKGISSSLAPQITPDARWVVFESNVQNFVTGTSRQGIFLKDLDNLSSPPILVSSIDSTQANQATFQGDGDSHSPQITPDGGWVVFVSTSTDFVTGGGGDQIYLKDLNNLSSPPVLLSSFDSVPSDQSGRKGNNMSSVPQITPDASWVVFQSMATNFVTGSSGTQIYRKDLTNLNLPPILISSLDSGQANQTLFEGDSSCGSPQITPDGRWVVFSSRSSNFVTGGGTERQIYIKDLTTLNSPPLSLSSLDSTQSNQTNFRGNGDSYYSQITPDGRWVVFQSNSTNLVTGGVGIQIYLRDLNSLSSPPLLISSQDSAQTDQTNFIANGNSATPQITPDGRRVTFSSKSSNLVPGGGPEYQIYLKDLLIGP